MKKKKHSMNFVLLFLTPHVKNAFFLIILSSLILHVACVWVSVRLGMSRRYLGLLASRKLGKVKTFP